MPIGLYILGIDTLNVFDQTDFLNIRLIYNSVGFGIAYPREMGNARALQAGWAMVQIPALFYVV